MEERNNISSLSICNNLETLNNYLTTQNLQSNIEVVNIEQNNIEKQNSSIDTNKDSNLINNTSSNNYLSWDEYFMNIAILTSLRSKDNNTKVGACLVDSHNRIIGCGYNGFIKGSNINDFPTNRNDEWINSKYPYVVHAEANALLNTTVFDITNSKLYSTLFPCNECSKLLIQKGISEVIYLSDKHHNEPPYITARKLLRIANIKCRQYNGIQLISYL